jgi:predicted nucleotidyltransferase
MKSAKGKTAEILGKERAERICEQYDISFLGLFGSHARGDFSDQSDIDLIVRFSKRKSLLDLVRLERMFSEILGRKVDLLTENSISPYLRDKIAADLKVIYDQKR